MYVRALTLLVVAASAALFGTATAQSSSSSPSSQASQSSSSSGSSQSPTLTTTLISTSVTETLTTSLSNAPSTVITTVVPTVFNSTFTVSASTASPSPSANATTNSTASATPTPDPFVLDTRINPAFGVLGGLLIVTGLPSAFLGHKNRWTSFFLTGFYTFALACFALIVKFGVLTAINPPKVALQGVFVVACFIAGVAGGGVTIFFWHQAKYLIGAWGGFALGLWVQCFRNGGLIRPIGFRWLLYIGLAVIGFCISTIQKIHYQTLLAATAAIGATAFILGIDCFTTAGLKEFYVWNLGFDDMFPKFTEAGIEFPISQMMMVEIGLIGAVTLMGAAVQLRILKILQIKIKELTVDQMRRDREMEDMATARFATTAKDLEAWEKSHGRKNSDYSGQPLMKEHDGGTPMTEGSDFTHVPYGHSRPRYQSGVSDFVAAPSPAPEDELGQPIDRRQSIGVLPAMDLGLDIEADITTDFLGETDGEKLREKSKATGESSGEVKKKEELLAEIQTIRKSIEKLRSESPSEGSGAPRSRHHSFASRRTLSQDLTTALRERPARAANPRPRVQSMDGSSFLGAANDVHFADDYNGEYFGRPTSAPLQHDDWNSYVKERTVVQPDGSGLAPALISPPLGSGRASQYITVPQAVNEAISKRPHLEADEFGAMSPAMSPGRDSNQGSNSGHESSQGHGKQQLQRSSKVPDMILPPKGGHQSNSAPNTQRQQKETPRTRTYEELAERHRSMMRSLQAPLLQQEKEQAELEAARTRWERSLAAEKQAMARREAEKAQERKEKKKEVKDGKEGGGKKDDKKGSASPSSANAGLLNADTLSRLPNVASSSKRYSVMKVEDWQRFNGTGGPGGAPGEGKTKRNSSVPFPGGAQPDKRTSSQRPPQ